MLLPKQPTDRLPVPQAASGGCLPPGREVSILALKQNRAIVKQSGLQEMSWKKEESVRVSPLLVIGKT